jgi:2-amino-4-hydroxy-6-hydroxymethyldihydropteridine diphosphokinase
VVEALLALGGNWGQVRTTLDRAVARLCDGIEVRLLARSSDYRTPPWGVTDQPPFINLCILVATTLTPWKLLERAQEVERSLGRNRENELRWGPRKADIDILSYGNVTMNTSELILPHPHLFERAFVLLPLAEILPECVIAGIQVRDALAKVDQTGIERLPPR